MRRRSRRKARLLRRGQRNLNSENDGSSVRRAADQRRARQRRDIFGGCNLGCVYCQNAKISVRAAGKPTSAAEFEKIVFDLEAKGVHNIDLITAAHFVPCLAPILEKVKPKLSIPIVYNSGGYEKPETLRLLDGLVDVYLPDYKYRSAELAKNSRSRPTIPRLPKPRSKK